ncbi:ladinin-1 [Salmo salar]|uniref:Ladinin-1 n=1 Tax=Salmo salar TaxID=8030 RepID=A0ABM3D155_SALSA|nr:ladinin-1 [Salmo salar]
MSISRKNWSALSRLARQWTVEDEEEVERERRRKERSYSSTDPDNDLSPENDLSPRHTPGNQPTNDNAPSITSAELLQLDFEEMLSVRDERRRNRHIETLRRQKGEEEGRDGGEEGRDGGEEGRVELLGDVEEGGRQTPPIDTPIQPSPSTPPSSISSPIPSTPTNPLDRQQQNGSQDPGPDSKLPFKFVSSLSISFDKSPSPSGHTSPMSPLSPTTPLSPARGAQSPTHYGHTEGSVDGSSVSLEQTARPAFARQSSRTVSFRMLRKKEEESMPLQRSASVRMASKTFEPSSLDQTEEQDKASPFQRNSKQRVSSRSIQEKMERLAHAAQKSESLRSPDIAHRTLFLLDEVSKKRCLFEKDQAAATCSPGVLRQEPRRFASGISDRINRWVSKTNRPGGSAHKPMDLHHVDIPSKRSAFESAGEDSSPNPNPHTKVDK